MNSAVLVAAFCCLFTSSSCNPLPEEDSGAPEKHPRVQDGSFDDIIMANSETEALYQGDIMQPVGRNAIADETAKWGAVVPYEIHKQQFAHELRSLIFMSLQEIAVRSCITFVERTNESNYILFERNSGCYSDVGMVGGRQTVSIGVGCDSTRTIIHEVYHALGFWHEQSRTDRDEYVQIVYENITSGMEYNFDKYEADKLDTQGVPYDYDSIMHYNDVAFSKDGVSKTIIPLKEGGENIGRRQHLSRIDVEELNLLYKGEETLDSTGHTLWTEWSPCAKDCSMNRKRFCDREDCANWGAVDLQTQDCTYECEVGYDTDCGPRFLNGTHGSVASPLFPYAYKDNTVCTTTIEAPPGARVKLIFQKLDIEDYNGGCYYDFLHIYDGPSTAATKYGTYCTNLPDDIVSSGETLTLEFIADVSEVRGGYYADYFIVYAPEHFCSFESGNNYCGWTDDTAQALTFTWEKGGTASVETGPKFDHTFGHEKGGYLFLESSNPAVEGDKAAIISPEFHTSTGIMCFNIWYSMYGINIDTLNVYVGGSGGVFDGTPIASVTGNKGDDKWYQLSKTITRQTAIKIKIEAVRGNGWKGDIAIDDVMLQEGPCP